MRPSLRSAKMVVMLLVASLESFAEAAPNPLAHMAIIAGAGERTPELAPLSQLEAVLATNGAFALIEREQIRRVLAEHELAITGSIRSDKTIQLGQLLAADILVFVERLPGEDKQVWLVQMVESSTGISLGHLVVTGEELMRDPAPMISALQIALSKWRVPVADRHYVGVLGFRSEEIGRSLDGLAASLDTWVPLDLAAATNIVILDREHLEHLVREQNLTGMELKFKNSAILLQGSIKHGQPGHGLEMKLLLQSFGQSTPEILGVNVTTNDLALIRETIAKAIWAKLALAVPRIAQFEPEQEASLFADRANRLYADQQYGAAAEAGEAALALDPTQQHRLAAARLRNEASARTYNAFVELAEGKFLVHDSQGRPLAPVDAQTYALRNALRAAELYREAVEFHLADLRRNPASTNSFPQLGGSTFVLHALQLSERPIGEEVLELRRQLQRNLIALFRLERDYYAAMWNSSANLEKQYTHPQSRWAYLLSISILSIQDWTDDVNEWASLLREVVASYRTPPGPFTYLDKWGAPPHRSSFWYHLAMCAPVRKFDTAAQRKLISEVAESFIQQPDPRLHLAGLNQAREAAWIIMRRQTPEEACRLLDVFLREMPYDHPVREQDNDYWFPGLFIGNAVVNLSDLGEREKYGRAILEPILRAKDGVRLCSWENLVSDWLWVLERNGKADEAREAAQQCLDLLPPDLKVRGSPQRLRGTLSRICERLTPAGTELPGAWSRYQLTLLATNNQPKAQLAAARFEQDRLLLLWAHRMSRQSATIHLASEPLLGGEMIQIGESTIKDFTFNPTDSVNVSLNSDHGLAWVARDEGLFLFRKEGTRLFTEKNGLQANDVKAVAYLDGKLYLGFAGGFADLDPTKDQITELAASRSSAARNPLDGHSFSAVALLADPARHCLWVSLLAYENNKPTPLQGLWKYLPVDGTFTKVFTPPSAPMLMSSPIYSLSWQRGQIIAGVAWMRSSLVAIQPLTLETTWLLDNEDAKGSKTPAFGLSVQGDNSWLWRGDELICAGQWLSLRTRTQTLPAILSRDPHGRKIADILGLHETEAGDVLFVTAGGDLWRLQRKTAPSSVSQATLQPPVDPER